MKLVKKKAVKAAEIKFVKSSRFRVVNVYGQSTPFNVKHAHLCLCVFSVTEVRSGV